MKLIHRRIIMSWIALGAWFTVLICACGLIIVPAIIQVIEGKKADQPPDTMICTTYDDGTKHCEGPSD